MNPLLIILAIVVVGFLAYLLLTGGFDVGENLQFIFVGSLFGALAVVALQNIVKLSVKG